MKIITLVENTSEKEECIAEHGLSIYIETEKHKLLLDTGQTDAVVRNAETLGIDLTAVDIVILSHGHYDHSGGILPFSKQNHTAQIVMQRTAAEPHYNGERYIGIDTDILKLPNVCLINGDKQLDAELFLFSGITGRRCYPQGNKSCPALRTAKRRRTILCMSSVLLSRRTANAGFYRAVRITVSSISLTDTESFSAVSLTM